jgi:ATP-dependent protease Clp ATPase subunit
MLDLMFDLPSSKKPARIKITKRMVEDGEAGAERVKPAVGE